MSSMFNESNLATHEVDLSRDQSSSIKHKSNMLLFACKITQITYLFNVIETRCTNDHSIPRLRSH